MKTVAGLIAVALMALPVKAQDMVFENNNTDARLVELYSSEGCSSCPPAETWLGGLKNSPGLWRDVFPVSFHVDYWDGLGWPDRFARPEYTARQRDYAARLGQDSVYTPEFVVNGREWRGWFDGEGLPAAKQEMSGQLTVSANGQNVSLLYDAPKGTPVSGLRGYIAVLGMNIVSDVQRGENGGRQLRHDFVVLGFVSAPLSVAADGKLQMKSAAVPTIANETPAAIVGWVAKADGPPVQIAGGFLQPATAAR